MWRGTKSQSLNVSRLVLQLPLPNPRSQVLSQEWRCSWSSVDSGCACLAPSHYQHQCWVIVNWTPGNKFQWNLSKNKIVFIKKMHLKMIAAKWWPFCLGLKVFRCVSIPLLCSWQRADDHFGGGEGEPRLLDHVSWRRAWSHHDNHQTSQRYCTHKCSLPSAK